MSDEKNDLDEALQGTGRRTLKSLRGTEATRHAKENANLRELLSKVEETDKAPKPSLVCPACGNGDVGHRGSNELYKLAACRGCGKVFPYALARSKVVHVSGAPIVREPVPDLHEMRAGKHPSYRDPRKNFKPGDVD